MAKDIRLPRLGESMAKKLDAGTTWASMKKYRKKTFIAKGVRAKDVPEKGLASMD